MRALVTRPREDSEGIARALAAIETRKATIKKFEDQAQKLQRLDTAELKLTATQQQLQESELKRQESELKRHESELKLQAIESQYQALQQRCAVLESGGRQTAKALLAGVRRRIAKIFGAARG